MQKNQPHALAGPRGGGETRPPTPPSPALGSYLCDRALHTFYTCGRRLPPPRSCLSRRPGHTTRGRSPRSCLWGGQWEAGGDSSARCLGRVCPPERGPMTGAPCSLILFS